MNVTCRHWTIKHAKLVRTSVEKAYATDQHWDHLLGVDLHQRPCCVCASAPRSTSDSNQVWNCQCKSAMNLSGSLQTVKCLASRSPRKSATMPVTRLSRLHPVSSSYSYSEECPTPLAVYVWRTSATEVYNWRKKWWHTYHCGVLLPWMGPQIK